MARKNKNKSVVKVDFSNVESNSLFPEIEARFRVVEVKFVDNDGDGALNWKWECVAADSDKYVGKTFSDRTSLSEGALWNLRNRLEALGAEVPSSEYGIDLESLVGLELEASNEHREWDGKEYNQLKNYVPVDEDNKDVKVTDKRRAKDEDEEEEEPKSKKKRQSDDDEDEAPKSKKKSRKDEDDEDEEEEPKSKKKSRKDDDDEDEDDAPKSKKRKVEDEDEEEPKSKKKRKSDDEDEEDEAPKSKKKSKKYTEDEIRDLEEDELQDVIDNHGLKVKLSKYDNLRKQRIAVVDALDEAGLIEE